MRRSWVSALLLAANGLLSIASAASASAPSPEDLFKWGEYDSLLRVLEPDLAESRGDKEFSRLDSILRAKTLLYAGVAYYATGKRGQADDAFTRACDLDSAIRIDPFYVSREIAGYFEGVAAAGARRRNAKRSGQEAPANRAARDDSARRSGNLKVAERQGRAWLWWSLGSMAALAGGGGAYYLITRDLPPDEHVTTMDLR